jgi:hypothetical protein
VVEQHDGAAARLRRRLRGARERGVERLEPVDPGRAVAPRHVEQLVAQRRSARRVAVGRDHGGQARLADVGMREAHEQGGAQALPAFLHLAGARLDLAVGEVVGALAHHMRQHRPLAPCHHRLDLARKRRQQHGAGAPPGLGDVDMRIGQVPREHRRVVDHRRIEIGVHVERDRDR